jgi:hypothetical protein
MFPYNWNYKASTAETESRILAYLGILDVPHLAKHGTKIVVAFDQNILFVPGNNGIFRHYFRIEIPLCLK